MTEDPMIDETPMGGASAPPEHTDVLVVGAGISGIGAAYHLQQQCPDKRYIVLESQNDFGGTWRTHTYPGIRSDSDLYTFGYRFKPWTGKPIATAQEILDYLSEVIDDNDLARNIRYGHDIATARWSGDDRRWTVQGTRTATGEQFTITASFLYMCQGYYRHSQGYTPTWPGMDRFRGTIVHPQTWPDGLDYQGKRVIVIGSGATAATIIPAMASDVEHITMLQRSPTYFISGRNVNELADTLRDLDVDEAWIHEIVRRKILFDQAAFTRRCFTEPEAVKAELLSDVRARLAPEHSEMVDTAFTPDYLPWRQRIAFVPEGDLFDGIKSGKASVVTDEIDTFTETGLALASGGTIDADIIITATGFDLNVLGDISFTIDGEPIDFSETVAYRGTMFTGVPNLAWVFGYFRASWTLRADLIADFVCRLLHHMDDSGAKVVVPRLRAGEENMPLLPWVDPENFNPGYLQRGMHLLPKQGDHEPWRHTQDYWSEKDVLPVADLDDGALVFER
jgi:cation diffusion facilitator CzcD-associated flavoprotein CzcO